MKKLLAQTGLAIFINLLMTPLVLIQNATADDVATGGAISGLSSAEVLELANPFTDIDACIKELKIDPNTGLVPDGEAGQGADAGYIIYISEEPLSSGEKKGETPTDKYVIRPCFRNTFEYTNPDTKESKSLPMLADKCSAKAQGLYEQWTVNGDEIHKRFFVRYSCKEVKVTLTKGGTVAIYGYIGDIYKWGASIVGVVTVTVIIISGIQISAAGGDPEAIGSAKKRIIQSIVGIVVLLLSGLILNTINPTFFTAN